jgi:hypothetical protein
MQTLASEKAHLGWNAHPAGNAAGFGALPGIAVIRPVPARRPPIFGRERIRPAV